MKKISKIIGFIVIILLVGLICYGLFSMIVLDKYTPFNIVVGIILSICILLGYIWFIIVFIIEVLKK